MSTYHRCHEEMKKTLNFALSTFPELYFDMIFKFLYHSLHLLERLTYDRRDMNAIQNISNDVFIHDFDFPFKQTNKNIQSQYATFRMNLIECDFSA